MRRAMIAAGLTVVLLTGCQPEADPKTDAIGAASTAPAEDAVTTDANLLKDVIERTPQYLVGITFPPVANAHPPLAKALKAYADAARADLAQAVKGVEATGSAATPYDLSLNFTDVSQGENAIVIAADGSLYTGGAHGIPLIARFTYLPSEQRLLAPADLIPDAKGWKAISDYVREQLADAVGKRLVEDDVPQGDRASIVKNAAGMIEEGTVPDAANFAQFEPIPSADGKWFGLRFVFPPYQVGPYSDGTQTVDVPASVLMPHLAPAYRSRFTGG